MFSQVIILRSSSSSFLLSIWISSMPFMSLSSATLIVLDTYITPIMFSSSSWMMSTAVVTWPMVTVSLSFSSPASLTFWEKFISSVTSSAYYAFRIAVSMAYILLCLYFYFPQFHLIDSQLPVVPHDDNSPLSLHPSSDCSPSHSSIYLLLLPFSYSCLLPASFSRLFHFPRWKNWSFRLSDASSDNHRPMILRSCFGLWLVVSANWLVSVLPRYVWQRWFCLKFFEILIFVPLLWTSRSFGVRNKFYILPQRDLRIRILFSARRSGVWLNTSSKNFVRRGCCRWCANGI